MDYWQRLTTLAAQVPLNTVTTQLAAMTATRKALSNRTLPKAPLPRLGLTPEAMLAAVVSGVLPQTVRALDHLLRHFRFYIAYHYGMWAFVNQPLFATWQRLYGPLRYLEVAAGNGYLALGLQAQGNQVVATDAKTWLKENVTGHQPVVPIVKMGATAALWAYGHQVDAVVLAWSPDKDVNDVRWLLTLRRHFPHLLVFVIGERFGVTNSTLFWQLSQGVLDRRLLALNQAFVDFDAVRDRIYRLH